MHRADAACSLTMQVACVNFGRLFPTTPWQCPTDVAAFSFRLNPNSTSSYLQGPPEQKPIQNSGEKGAWAYPGTAQIFWVPLLSHEWAKATNFKFCTHIHRIDRNRLKPVKNLGESGRGRTQGLSKINQLIKHVWRSAFIQVSDQLSCYK